MREISIILNLYVLYFLQTFILQRYIFAISQVHARVRLLQEPKHWTWPTNSLSPYLHGAPLSYTYLNHSDISTVRCTL